MLLPWVFALVSGVGMALCFAPASWGDFCWVALVPLVWAVWFCRPASRRNRLRQFLLGYVFGCAFFGGSLLWLTTLTTPGWAALTLYLAVYPGVWAVFLGTLGTPGGEDPAGRPLWLGSAHNLRVCGLGAVGWVTSEWLRGVLFPQFPWNEAGIALSANIPLIQISDFSGVGGVSFLVAFSNLMLAATARRLQIEIRLGARRPHYDFAAAVALVALAWGYGVRQIFAPPPHAVEFSFAAVQANVPQNLRNDLNFEPDVLARYARGTEAALAMKPDLILWPESATPRPMFNDQGTWDFVKTLAEKHAGDFLLGTVHFSEEGDYNAAVLLADRGRLAQIYYKIHLVPFGEYVPFRKGFPLFAWLVGDLVPDDFDCGTRPVVFEMSSKPVKIGPLICFEDVVGDLARQFALAGAQAFAVVTNDGWFLRSAGSRQHVAHAVFRCAENKLPMIRAANTGVTCLVDRFGRIAATLQTETGSTFLEGILFNKVAAPLSPKPTFYARHGEVFSIACLLASAVWLAVCFIRFWKKKISACPTPPETKPSAP